MAFIKYKELAYVRFWKRLNPKELPSFVFDYLESDEEIWIAYGSSRKRCLLTNKKLVLFAQKGIFGKTKKIDFFPYNNISSSAIEYKESTTSLLFSMDSGYQLTIMISKLTSEDKTELREIYFKMMEIVGNK